MNIVVTKKFAKDVDKELNELQKQQLAQILVTITQSKMLTEILNCKKLKGFKNAYRIKLGDFRIGLRRIAFFTNILLPGVSKIRKACLAARQG
jgi:mRNA interferase RelE/StbE